MDSVGAESWTVEEDGVLHGKGLTKAYGYLETDKDYKDFQLSLRFKCVGDGNSGVFFHTAFKPNSVDATQGMQFEIDCTMMHHTAGVYAEDGRGWVVWPAPENEGVVRKGSGTTTFLRWSGTATVRGLMALRWWILPTQNRALPTDASHCNCMPAAKETCSSRTSGFEICQSGEILSSVGIV